MKTSAKILAAVMGVTVVMLARQSLAQKVTIDDVKVSVQPTKGPEFQLHFDFRLPDFDGAPVDIVNIDYAVLTFQVEVKPAGVEDLKIFEVLVADHDKRKPRPDLAYNSNPVTAIVHRKTAGIEQVTVDMTQLVDHWVHRGIENNGLLIVSHRRLGKKILRSDKLEVLASVKPSATIYYTVLD